MYTFAVLFSVSPHFFAANVFKRSIKCWVMRAWLFEESCTFLRRIGRLRGISSLIPLGRIFSRRRITRLIGIIPLVGIIYIRRNIRLKRVIPLSRINRLRVSPGPRRNIYFQIHLQLISLCLGRSDLPA